MDSLDEIAWEIAEITPSAAAEMLGNVHASGHVDQLALAAFGKDMSAGQWVLNGAPIVLSSDGSLLDGRARLHACVKSGAPFQTLVVKGVSSSAFETIDSVRKRTLADILSMRSELHGRSLGAALRIIWSYQAGAAPGGGKGPGTTALLSVLEQAPEIRDSVLPALRAMPLLPQGCGIAMHYLASRISPEKADQFMAQIGEPVSTAADNPVVQLRNALTALRGQGGARKQTYMLAITIKAWNAFSQGKSIKHLRFGAERESFPRLEPESRWGPLGDIRETRHGEKLQQSTGGLKVRVALITPKMAELMLADRGPNRNVSLPVINKYARDMLAGRWRLNGQTIKIGRDGRLLDGQHRLEAAKKAKCSFPAIIVEGLRPEIFASLDIGRRRSISDVLRDYGESHTMILASALRWLWMIENGVILAANSSPTNGELLEVLNCHPNIRASITQVSAIREIMGSGIAAALHRTFADKDTPRANEFFARLIDGVQLAEHSPIRHLRERLIRTRASHRVRLAEAERVAISIKAWNAYREDRPIQLLIWRSRGSAREALPAVS